MSITIDKQGRRVYLRGNTYSLKDEIKNLGGHWDSEERAWWVGSGRLQEVEELIAAHSGSSSTTTETTENPNDIRLVGKCKYKGRTYYARYLGPTKKSKYAARLISLDQKVDFWASCAEPGDRSHDGSGDVAVVIKTYAPREYRGQTVYTTLGSIQQFLEDKKEDEQRKQEGMVETRTCWECGREFTQMDARTSGGDWSDSYCGC